MRFDQKFWTALALLLVWLPLAWFSGTWMGLQPPIDWYSRIGLFLAGIVGFTVYLVLRPRRRYARLGQASANLAREIDYNFAKAAKRIQAATGGNRQLNSLPAVFLLGDVGSAKTTILNESGIAPDLLAGQAVQNSVVVPTLSVNLWYGRHTLFVDPAGTVMADPVARRKLFKKLLQRPLKSRLSRKPLPMRSVLLTVDCETFLLSGGVNAAAAKARDYQSVLTELSLELGANLPVHVLFTKADKILYFRDFVENLNATEATELLGLSLPLPALGQQGLYAENLGQRLDSAFQSLSYSLADKRPIYLARERIAGNLSNIYEFPREFAKLRSSLVQFLTDLCPTSQARTTPFLRGFYFSGVRPPLSSPPVEGRLGGSRRTPQSLFLRNLLAAVLKANQHAVTAATVKTNVTLDFVYRVAPATTAALVLLLAGWWTIAYINNFTLIRDALTAAKALPPVALASGQLASADALQSLSKVRQTLTVLQKHQREGAPLSYRAFLYHGGVIHQPLRQIYFSSFRRLLLQPTQQTLIQVLKNPGDDKTYDRYQSVYGALKAYLITTSNRDKRWSGLVPVLVRNWSNEQPVGDDRQALASTHFAFYAQNLPDDNPYPQYSQAEKYAVARARVFLNGFPLEDRIYWALLDAAGDRLKSIQFNGDYPGTAETVRNTYDVYGCFTKPAYANYQKRLQDLNVHLGLEEWVLGQAAEQDWDLPKIRTDLKLRYEKDYLDTWREFLVSTTEALPYGTYLQAAAVLEKFGGPKSALFQLFCVASENTNVGNKDFTQTFQPVQLFAPPGCSRQKPSATAAAYVEGLASLSKSLKAIGPIGSQDELAAFQAQRAVANALNAESALALGFQPDPNDTEVTVETKSESLLKDPITAVPPTLVGLAGTKTDRPAATPVR